MVNAREIAKAFAEGKPYFDGKYLVVKMHPYEHCEKRAIAYTSYIGTESIGTDTFVYISFHRDYLNCEAVYVSINKAPNVSEAVEILNEVSDYIHDIVGVRITAFTVDNDAVYLLIKGRKYPYREYKNKTTIFKRERSGKCIEVRGYYNRFALFRDCKECIEYATIVSELRKRIGKLFEEFRQWYCKLDAEALESILGYPIYRRMARLRYTVNSMLNRDVVVENVGMYLWNRTPRGVVAEYESMARRLEQYVEKAKEIYALNTLTS
jgi:hypothetical protein